jgi:hypothetical protein
MALFGGPSGGYSAFLDEVVHASPVLATKSGFCSRLGQLGVYLSADWGDRTVMFSGKRWEYMEGASLCTPEWKIDKQIDLVYNTLHGGEGFLATLNRFPSGGVRVWHPILPLGSQEADIGEQPN